MNNVIWSDFVWSNGIDEIDDTHIKFDTKPIVFDRDEYEKAIDTLYEMIQD